VDNTGQLSVPEVTSFLLPPFQLAMQVAQHALYLLQTAQHVPQITLLTDQLAL